MLYLTCAFYVGFELRFLIIDSRSLESLNAYTFFMLSLRDQANYYRETVDDRNVLSFKVLSNRCFAKQIYRKVN